MRFSLLYRGNAIELSSPVTLVGRSVSCKLLLEGSAVSRRHARLRIADDQLFIADLKSNNGVFVNGERLTAEREHEIEHGDRVLIGGHELQVVARPSPPENEEPEGERSSATRVSIDRLWDDDDDIDAFASVTKRTDPLALMSGAVAEALAAGQVDQAESAFDVFVDILEGRVHDRGPDWRGLAERGCVLALRLASASGRARWLDMALDLACARGQRLLGERFGELEQALRSVGAPSRAPLEGYIALLDAHASELTDGERRLLRRLHGRLRAARPSTARGG